MKWMRCKPCLDVTRGPVPPKLGGAVCSKPTRSALLIEFREALLINRYCSSLNRPPQPSLREGIPPDSGGELPSQHIAARNFGQRRAPQHPAGQAERLPVAFTGPGGEDLIGLSKTISPTKARHITTSPTMTAIVKLSISDDYIRTRGQIVKPLGSSASSTPNSESPSVNSSFATGVK